MTEEPDKHKDDTRLVELLDGNGQPFVKPLGPIQHRLVELVDEEEAPPLVEPLGPIIINDADTEVPLVELIGETPETDK